MDIKEYLQRKSKIVDEEIEKFFPKELDKDWLEKHLGVPSYTYDVESCDKSIRVPVWDLLERGGKRWRPIFMLVCCESVRGDLEECKKFIPIPEIIHNGTLMVDDIEDNSYKRRGKDAIHKIYGVDIAINAGNSMYFLTQDIVKNSNLNTETKLKIYELINKEMLRVHFGQGMDILWHKGKKSDIKENDYLQMCAYKTGVLARMSSKMGVIIGRGTEKQEILLGKFAESIGVAFQIQDDILNLKHTEEWGKDYGEDISEGKRTLIILRTFQVAGDLDKDRLKEILDMQTKDKELVKEAIDIINKYDGIKYSKNKAGELVKDAWNKVENILEESNGKNILKAFGDYLIEREI